jgi:hypothetical protein
VLETSVASSWFTDYPERWSIVFFPDLFWPQMLSSGEFMVLRVCVCVCVCVCVIWQLTMCGHTYLCDHCHNACTYSGVTTFQSMTDCTRLWSPKIILPSDVVTTLVCMSTLHDVYTTRKLHNFVFWPDWGLNSGLHLVGRYSYHLSHSTSPFFVMLVFFKIGLVNYLLGLASKCDPPDLCLLSN